MRLRIFELFARVITALPPQCVVKAVELECQMLKNDIEKNRLPLPEDAFSIFCFREFVRAAKLGQILNCSRAFPPNHVEFFKETIVRLIQADELPSAAMEQFDCVFLNDLS